MERSELFKINTKEFWADLAVHATVLIILCGIGDAMVHVNSQPWYWGFLFFFSIIVVTDRFMRALRFTPVWPWKRDAK